MNAKNHKNKSREFIKAITYCLSLAWQSSKFHIITRLVCSIAAPATSFAMVFLVKRLLDLLITHRETDNPIQTLVFLFLSMFALSLIKLLSQRLEQYCRTVHEDILNSKLSMLIIEQGINVDIEYFDDNDFYNKLTSAARDMYQFANVLWNVITCVSAFISFVMVFVILVRKNALYGIILIIAGLPAGLAAVRYTKHLYHLSFSQIEGEREKSYINDISTDKRYAQDIRLFNAGSFLKKRYSDIWERIFEERRKSIKIRSFVTGMLDCLPEAALIYIGFDISLKILGDTASVGDYTLYTGLAAQLWNAIYMLSISLTQIYDNQLRINNFKSIEKIEKRINHTGTMRLSRIDTIDFKNVCFTYPCTVKPALQNVNFSIDKGKKVVFAGLNGSGKSTLIKLLLRFYDTDSGVILINGIDIKEYSTSDVRKNFSVYFQDESNYAFTLRDNIAIADTGVCDTADNIVNDTAIIKAFTESLSDDILVKAPKGLYTYLMRVFSNDGLELSGGQHQKIALARTFFRHHTAIILDEPSSNLDPKAEHELFENLKRLTDGKTTIFTSHRLSNIFLADSIIVMEDGEIIETGTQSELIKKNGRYAELYKYQQEKYNIENSDN